MVLPDPPTNRTQVAELLALLWVQSFSVEGREISAPGLARQSSNLRRFRGTPKGVLSRECFVTQEGCGRLGGENPGAFPKAGPIFQQPFPCRKVPETLVGIALRAARKSSDFQQCRNLPASEEQFEFAGQPQPFSSFLTQKCFATMKAMRRRSECDEGDEF